MGVYPSHSARLRVSTIVFALAAVGVLGVGACRKPGKVKYAPASVPRVLNVQTGDLQPAISARLATERPEWVTDTRWKRVSALYQRFENAPLWLEEGGVKDRATALLDAIRSAPEHALDTAAYPISAIQQVVDAKRLTDTASAKTLAEADVLLTSAYLAYATDMLVGQVDPKTVSQAWHIPVEQREIDSAAVRGIEETDMRASLESMAPQDDDYRVLRSAYARYRALAANGGWPPIPDVPSASRNALVRQRIETELAGDSSSVASAAVTNGGAVDSGAIARDSAATRSVDSTVRRSDSSAARRASRAAPLVSDTGLTSLIKQYQDRHGLERTGKIDKPTLAALNVPAADRVQQLAANLERHRWLPRSLGSRYVYVNVPAFRLDAYDSGQKTLSMKVVVGEEYEGKVTPVFSDSMETVVFRPYWNITPDIQAKEVAPKVARDPGYLDRNDMEYYRDGGARRIRQRPGGKNSLGLVKFLFPNDFNIYLHDTPAKALFEKTDRAASHGCIRLEKPAELAQWALGWDATKVSDAMHTGPNNRGVRVSPKIPVYIVYFTAYARDGQLYFGDDVYGRDDTLERQVVSDASAPPPPATTTPAP